MAGGRAGAYADVASELELALVAAWPRGETPGRRRMKVAAGAPGLRRMRPRELPWLKVLYLILVIEFGFGN